jgi:hypothetical protein
VDASEHDGDVIGEAEGRSPSTALPVTATRSRRHGVIALLATVAILVGAPIVVITHSPNWTLRPLAFATPGEDVGPRGWSRDGTRFLFSRLDQFVVVRVADGARVFTGYGAWPVWVDNDTIDAIQDFGPGRSQIGQISLTGQVTYRTLPPVFETAKLVGEGPLEVAATTNIGSIWTSVVDPLSGRIVAHLPDVRAMSWAGTGRLITKTSEPFAGVQGFSPGRLRAWTARTGLRPIGGDLLEIADVVSAAPSGDVIACVCALSTDGSQTPGSIYLVPVDGGPPRKLFDLTRGDVNIQTNFGWLSDGSLLVLDGVGFHRFALDGTALAVPTIPATDMPPSKYAGRAYVLGGDIIIGSQLGSATTGTSRLTIRHLDGNVLMARTFPSWNGLGLVTDHNRPRALVGTDPQAPGEPPEAYFVLERL